jgi:hypothetical protein
MTVSLYYDYRHIASSRVKLDTIHRGRHTNADSDHQLIAMIITHITAMSTTHLHIATGTATFNLGRAMYYSSQI